jgi:hypothetical protein
MPCDFVIALTAKWFQLYRVIEDPSAASNVIVAPTRFPKRVQIVGKIIRRPVNLRCRLAMTPEEEKTFDIKIRAAERAHDVARKGAETHNSQIEVFSLAAMRAPALAAAGGIAAALGFYSANHVQISGSPIATSEFGHILIWLLIALLMTIAAPGLAYFSQLAYLHAAYDRIYIWDHPYVKDGRRAKLAERIGHVFRWACVFSVLASIICAAMGGIALLRLISVMSAP